MLTSPESPIHARRPRVLIVEDNDSTRHWIAETLIRAGYDAEEAIDGLDALRRSSTSSHEAIVLDLVMPHVDGWQFRETALRHPELASIPTVVVTVRPLREADRYALRTPFILHKPLTAKELIEMLRTACLQASPLPNPPPRPADIFQSLFWSRRGEVACSEHAPQANTDRWRDERWGAIPPGAGKGRITYQCQYCHPKSPIARQGWANGDTVTPMQEDVSTSTADSCETKVQT